VGGSGKALTPASIVQELNIITTVAYKFCADYSILMISSLITSPADAVHSRLATVWAVFCRLQRWLEQPEQYLATPNWGDLFVSGTANYLQSHARIVVAVI